jgi:hypothetical protein
MKSPFPGMDPFIESCGLWGDFHHSLIQEIKRSLNRRLPAGYIARTGEREYVVLATASGEKEHVFSPDVTVASVRDSSAPAVSLAVAEPTSEPEPISAQAFIEEGFRETFIEIREAGSENLVTCIEALSPSNKRPNTEGWNVYLRKRQGLLLGRSASLIEIDLLREGQRMPMVGSWPSSPYTLLVARRGQGPRCLVWPGYSLRPLPPIPVPLLSPDPDVTLELQPIVELIYAESRYHESIDYACTPAVPLNPDEAAWLQQQSQ